MNCVDKFLNVPRYADNGDDDDDRVIISGVGGGGGVGGLARWSLAVPRTDIKS